MAQVSPREFIYAYASDYVKDQLSVNLFTQSPFLGALGLTNGNGGWTPDSSNIIGRQMSLGEKEMIDGSPNYKIQWIQGKIGGGQQYTYGGASASAASASIVDKTRACQIAWAMYGNPITIRNMDILFARKSSNPGVVLSGLVEKNTKLAMSEHQEYLANQIYQGAPSSYTDEVSDSMIGLFQWVHDSNSIAGVNRALASNSEFRAQRSTATPRISYQLIDDIFTKGIDNGAGGMTRPLNDFVGNQKYIIITNSRAYSTLKAEVLSRQLGRVCSGNDMPSKPGWMGWKGEYLNINGVTVFSDPFCKDLATPTNNPMFVLNSDDWTFQTMKGELMNVRKAVDLPAARPASGEANTTNSEITTVYRLACDSPARQLMIVNVKA